MTSQPARAADCPRRRKDPLRRRALRHRGAAGADLRKDRQADQRQSRLSGRGVRRHRLQRRDRSDAQRQARARRVRSAGLRAGASGGESRSGRRIRRRDSKPVTYWASIVTYPSSGIKTIADIRGHSFAFSDAASTSGHLFPAYGLRKAGIDPDKDIKALYAGSHTASFEAIYNHKVDAGELNSEQLESATQRGHYKDGDVVFLWKSDPIPTDPFAVRGDMPTASSRSSPTRCSTST